MVPEHELWLANYYAELGMRRLPDDWRFPYLIGANWYYDRDDLPRTRYYWEKAVELPGADPLILERLGTVHRRLGELEKAVQRLEDLLKVVKEPGIRNEVKLRLEVFRNKLKKSKEASGAKENKP